MNTVIVAVVTLVAAGLALQLATSRRTIRDLRRRLAIAEARVGTDPLTGLANRVGLHRALAATHRNQRAPQVSMLLLDVDRLKQINDEHGHLMGDAVLVEIAQRIVAPGAPVLCAARLGGDEFVVVLAPTSDTAATAAADAAEYARALWWNVGAPVVIGGLAMRVTASIGIAALPADNTDELLRAADKAMYRAKRTGSGVCLDEAHSSATPTVSLAPAPQESTSAHRHPHLTAPPAAS